MTGGGLRETVWLIVCEPAPRWTPALKAWLAQHPPQGATFRVLTADRARATELIARTSPTLLLVETETADLGPTLAWLTSLRQTPNAIGIALLGRSFAAIDEDRLTEATDALREAGAAEVFRSASELPAAVQLAECHAQRLAAWIDAAAMARDSVWRRLPWQPDPTPLR